MGAITIISFLFFTGFVAVVSYLKTRRRLQHTTDSHFFAGRKNNFWIVGGALLLSNISANQFIGENESIYINNMSVIAWGITSVLAMLIVAEYFLPIYLRTGAMTIPDFLGKRYDNATRQLVSFVFLASYMVNLLPSVLYGGAVAFTGMFNFLEPLHLTYWQNIWIMVWVIGLIGTLYSVLGGLRAIAISDSLLSLGLLTVGVLIPYFGFQYLGQGDWQAGFVKVFTTKREHLNAIGAPGDEVPFNTIFTGMFIINLYYWGMEQFIVQQALSAKSLRDSQKGMALACIGKLLCPFLINLPGLIGMHLYETLPNTAEVFPRVVKDTLPAFVNGLTAAVVLGAAITTFNAGLNSSSTLFTLNVYKPHAERRGRNLTDKQLLIAGKRFEIFLALLAMLAAPFIIFSKSGFYTYLQQLSGMFCVPVFTIVIIGFLTKKVPPTAAKTGILFFIISYIICNYILNIKIHYLHMLAILFVLTTACMFVVTAIAPKFTYNEIKLHVVPLEPWKNRGFVYFLLLLGMVAVFVLFSRWGIAAS